MNCPNCGRELAEGEVCNCIPTEESIAPEAPQQVAPEAPQAAPQQNYYVPPQEPAQAPQPETYYVPPVGAPQFSQQQNQQYYAPQPQPEVPARTDYPEGYTIKKKTVAVLLAVTLGMFGIHNYYLGNNNKALTQLLVCLLGSIVFGIGAIVAYVWAIVEAVLILTEKEDKDANGYKIMTFEESIAKAINENKE